MSHKQKRRCAILALAVCLIAYAYFGFGSYDILFANVSAICLMMICWFQYDHEQPRLATLVLCACMITIAVAGRLLFVWAPAFKPLSAIILLAGVWLSGWNGFLCGSLAALLSDLFFGLGPWTIFQMLAWGSVGALGSCIKETWFHHRIVRLIVSVLAAVLFSLIMDTYTALSTGGLSIARLLFFMGTSLPFLFIYIISNIVFVELCYPFFQKKMERIIKKYDL